MKSCESLLKKINQKRNFIIPYFGGKYRKSTFEISRWQKYNGTIADNYRGKWFWRLKQNCLEGGCLAEYVMYEIDYWY